METAAEDSNDAAASAMDLYTSQPPSVTSTSTPLPPLPFSGSLMEGIFPETSSAGSMFDDVLAPIASSSTAAMLDAPAAQSSSEDILQSLALTQPAAHPASFIPADLDTSNNAEAGPSTTSTQATLSTEIEITAAHAAITEGEGSSSNLTATKRGRGRPRKPPNAPTRTKYARITKEEMMSEDDVIGSSLTPHLQNDEHQRSSKSTSSNGTTPQPSNTSIGTGKGKEKGSSSIIRGNSSSNSSNTTATNARTRDAKGKKPAELVEMRTKSGRTVHKPEVYVPTFEPSFRRRKPLQTRTSTDSQHCSICGRGHSPTTNQIVICDECNTTYHQLCHDPSIPNEAIDTSDSMWYCQECDLKRNSQFPKLSWEEGLPASGFSVELIREYLRVSPRDNLIQTLMSVIEHYPDARLFPSNMAELLEIDKSRRNRSRQARSSLSTSGNNRILSRSPASLGESTNKRKRRTESLSTSLNRPNYFEGSEEEQDDDDDVNDSDTIAEGRASKAVKRGEESRASQNPSSPSKGNATTQTDDVYLQEGDDRIRYPSHPEDRPGSMSYFEMLRNAIRDINDPEGVPPRRLYEWISEKYALPDNFRPSAGQALQKAAKKQHFLKNGSLYRINPEYENMKAVKRPVRKSRNSLTGGSDASIQSSSNSTTTATGSTHQRNLSNQTTGSTRSTITSISEEGNIGDKEVSATTTTGTLVPQEGPSESIQGEGRSRAGISLDEVIARQHNMTSADPTKAEASSPKASPKSMTSNLAPAATGVTSPSSQLTSPQHIPAATAGSSSNNNQIFTQNPFDPAPKVQQRHRPSVSFASGPSFTNPSQASLSASLAQQQQQKAHTQVQTAQQMLRQPDIHTQVYSQQISPARPDSHVQMQNQVYGYPPSGDAGIDSMLAELMGQTPTERMNVPTAQIQARSIGGMSSTGLTSGYNYPHSSSQAGRQVVSPGSVMPSRPSIPSRSSFSAPGHPSVVSPHLQNPSTAQQLHQQQQQQAFQQQQQQQAHLAQQQQQQQHHHQQQLNQQFRQAQHPYLMHNVSDPAIYGGGPPNQFTPSQSPEMQAYNPQYGYQTVQQQQQQQHQQQQHLHAQQRSTGPLGQYHRAPEPGQ